jgi:glycosyltransferase involved in cell wall biosynthesis
LPVITTDTHSTVNEIRDGGAGEVCEMSADAYAHAIEEILENYERYQTNSLQLAKLYDGIHGRVVAALES